MADTIEEVLKEIKNKAVEKENEILENFSEELDENFEAYNKNISGSISQISSEILKVKTELETVFNYLENNGSKFSEQFEKVDSLYKTRLDETLSEITKSMEELSSETRNKLHLISQNIDDTCSKQIQKINEEFLIINDEIMNAKENVKGLGVTAKKDKILYFISFIFNILSFFGIVFLLIKFFI